MNFGAYPMVQRPHAPRHPLLRRRRRSQPRARSAQAALRRGAARAGLVTFAPDDIDWDDEVRLAIEERASLSPDALTGMEASLRFAGAETMETRIFGRLTAWQNWIFNRPNAVGEQGALKVFGTGDEGRNSTGSGSDGSRSEQRKHMASTTAKRSRTTSTWPTTETLQRALEHWQPKFLRLVARDGADRLRRRRRLPAHRRRRGRRRAGRATAR